MIIAGGVALTGSLSGCFSIGSSANLPPKALQFHSAVWNRYPFKVSPLAYSNEALEPFINSETMQLHHDKHHVGYAKKLNETLSSYPELQNLSCAELLCRLEMVPEAVRTSLRNFGGGHINHSLFWESMTPNSSRKPGKYTLPSLLRSFGTVSEFRTAFENAGSKVFGSGWVWLVSDKEGNLSIINTPNQDSPLSQGYVPLLGNDIWEHAYYLTYRTDRAKYLSEWWNIVDWNVVEQRYEAVRSVAI
jgi:superoxide dismutase, Fe-Mn family